MISVSTVNDALKSFYLDVLINQLNSSISPLYSRLKATEAHISGKEAVKPVCYDLSSGIAALSEYGDLPEANGNNYVNLRADLKNLYGTIEITDKAMRASENNQGAVVNLLNAEMEGLLATAKQNFSRMLYGNGSGCIAKITAGVSASAQVEVDNTKYIKVGFPVDVVASGVATTTRIVAIDGKTVTLANAVTASEGDIITLAGSYNNEIFGIETIFTNPATLYGVSTEGKAWMKPYINDGVGEISDIKIQTAIDAAEEASGGKIDFITCSYGVRRAYQEYLEKTKRNINPVELEGGFKTISYAGIPVVADRFCGEGNMYVLDTKLFEMHQLCDWRWLEGESGNVLKQLANKAAYKATLVKYANLICSLPCGQAKLSGIVEK